MSNAFTGPSRSPHVFVRLRITRYIGESAAVAGAAPGPASAVVPAAPRATATALVLVISRLCAESNKLKA